MCVVYLIFYTNVISLVPQTDSHHLLEVMKEAIAKKAPKSHQAPPPQLAVGEGLMCVQRRKDSQTQTKLGGCADLSRSVPASQVGHAPATSHQPCRR